MELAEYITNSSLPVADQQRRMQRCERQFLSSGPVLFAPFPGAFFRYY